MNFVLTLVIVLEIMRLFATLAMPLALFAAHPALAGDLSGTVSDAKAQPVAGMTVSIPALSLTTQTDADGAYSFADLPEGGHEIAVSVNDEAVQFAFADVPADGSAKRNIFLFSRAVITTARTGMSPQDAAEAARITSEAMEAAEAMLQDADRHEIAPELFADASRG